MARDLVHPRRLQTDQPGFRPFMSTAAQSGIDTSAFEAFLAGRDEPDWLRGMRRDAWQAFLDLPMPTRADEEWIRTDIRLFRLDRFSLPTAGQSESSLADVLTQGVVLGGRSQAVDSRPEASELAEKWRQRGVLFGSLDRLAIEHAEMVRPHLMGRTFNARYDMLAALHGACWSGGTLLYVPKKVVVDETLFLFSFL
jgi:Fe-S cluster assembly protein SufD